MSMKRVFFNYFKHVPDVSLRTIVGHRSNLPASPLLLKLLTAPPMRCRTW